MTLDYSEVSLMIATFFINLQCQKRTGSIGNFSTSLENVCPFFACFVIGENFYFHSTKSNESLNEHHERLHFNHRDFTSPEVPPSSGGPNALFIQPLMTLPYPPRQGCVKIMLLPEF